MASVAKAIAQSGSISGASGTSAVLSLEALTTDLIPTVQVSALGAGTALAVTMQHSPDGVYWDDVVALENVSGGASLAAAGILLKQISNTTPVYGNVRFSWTLTAGTTTATAIFSVYYDKRR
jgi:hypothetical protein